MFAIEADYQEEITLGLPASGLKGNVDLHVSPCYHPDRYASHLITIKLI